MKKLTSPFQLIKKSIDLFSKKENFVFLAKVYLPMVIFPILSIIFSYLPFFTKNVDSSWFTTLKLVVSIIDAAAGVFFMAAGVLAIANVIDGKVISLKEVFKNAWKTFWPLLFLSVVLGILYTLGFVLLVVPGVLLVVWLAFSRFIMIEKGTGIKESMIESKSITKGYFWKILWRLIIFSLFTLLVEIILNIVPFGIGLIVYAICGGLFLLPIYFLYREISVQ